MHDSADHRGSAACFTALPFVAGTPPLPDAFCSWMLERREPLAAYGALLRRGAVEHLQLALVRSTRLDQRVLVPHAAVSGAPRRLVTVWSPVAGGRALVGVFDTGAASPAQLRVLPPGHVVAAGAPALHAAMALVDLALMWQTPVAACIDAVLDGGAECYRPTRVHARPLAAQLPGAERVCLLDVEWFVRQRTRLYGRRRLPDGLCEEYLARAAEHPLAEACAQHALCVYFATRPELQGRYPAMEAAAGAALFASGTREQRVSALVEAGFARPDDLAGLHLSLEELARGHLEDAATAAVAAAMADHAATQHGLHESLREVVASACSYIEDG